MKRIDDVPITFVGHPWAPIGMGEQLRSHLLAARALQLDIRVFDIFKYAMRTDPDHRAVVEPLERLDLPGGVRVFHINGDEVERVIAAFEANGGVFAEGYNIIVPAWELPVFPQDWVAGLRRFDEVWAISRFTQGALKAAGIESHWIGQAVEVDPAMMLGRRHFGIRESAFVLLHFFDLSSYATRKNPQGVLALFDRLRAASPFMDVQLVLKVKNGERDAAEWAASVATDPQIKVIAAPLDTRGVRSLISAADCFVSLHRAEGFGRGLGEAMALGRLAMATGWSGNLDFMTDGNSLLVGYRLVELTGEDYPHGLGQVWAEPDLDDALRRLQAAMADSAEASAIARRGRLDVLRGFGYRAVGLRMLARLEAAVQSAAASNAGPTPRSRARRRK